MRRKTFDGILTAGGALLALVLVVAGALLMWGAVFTQNEVHSQLAAQKVYFPTAAAFAHAKPGTEITPGMKPYLLQYAGQEVLTGAQAEAYADHFIAVHLSEMPYHGVYSLISTAARAATPGTAKAAQLSALETTSFQGTTLRSMLLEAYAFGTIGSIALIASIVSFVLAAVSLLLTFFGYLHWRRTSPTVEI
ncbi:MAG: hypothetical protein M0027_00830 [Candidatus Dormibacteraeota bacterium]|nr:hypothetical protein [Candidatus Dormibacteraeota bacterium]